MRIHLRFAMALLLGLPPLIHAENAVVSLSHYDEKTPDYTAMKQAGVEAVIHEATYPPLDCDPKYRARQSEATRNGVLWGAYHFGNATDGKKQADHFLDFVTPRSSSGVLMILDAERNTHYPGGSMRVEQAVQFIERIHERTGIYPGVYSNENWIKDLFANPAVDAASRQVLGKCWLWIANYHYQPVATAPWPRWMFWQYTGDGVCAMPRNKYPTRVANLDKIERTIFNGDRAALHQFWAEHTWRSAGG